MEKITAAAIQKNGVVYSVPQPLRHDAAIRKAIEALGGDDFVRQHEQGFVTSEGRFVSRKEAEKIAYESGQLERRFTGIGVVSEDLW